MEKVSNPARWFKVLVKDAKGYPSGLKETVFKVQAYG
ncbi:MAG: hypothetical protein V1752_04345 [Candidatus Firestonebacteria bacterium]